MAHDIVVVGSINWDWMALAKRLPRPGETLEGERFLEGPGGKGANQAVAAARLGARVALVGRAGRDRHGEAALERLRAEGMDAGHVVHDETEPTGVALIMVGEGGEKQIVATLGANRRLSAADVRRASQLIEGAAVLLMQLEVPLECIGEAARIAKQAGVRVMLDPAPAASLPDELLGRLDVVRANAHEAEVLTGVEVRDRASARRAAERLRDRGVGIVVVQAGSEGNLLLHEGGDVFLPKLAVESVDVTGAGDALAAALAVRLAEGADPAEAARFASAAAALATTGFGAQAALPRRAQVEEALRSASASPPAW